MGRPVKRLPPPVVKHSGKIDREALNAKGGLLESKRGHWVRNELKRLEVGELYFVHRNEWNWKGKANGPARIVSDLNKNTKLKFKTWLVADGTGWAIERLE